MRLFTQSGSSPATSIVDCQNMGYFLTYNGRQGNPVLQFTLSNLLIQNCNSTGGAAFNLYNNPVNLNFSNMVFTNNIAIGQFGGAISVENSYLIPGSTCGITISNSNFTSNNATGGGGALYFAGCNITCSNTTFTNNVAAASNTLGGGAIYSSDQNMNYVYPPNYFENCLVNFKFAIYPIFCSYFEGKYIL